VPTLTMHAEDDPTAFVELESAFHDEVVAAGRQSLLAQVFTSEHDHSKLAAPEYVSLFRGMLRWISDGRKPTVETLTTDCAYAQKSYGERCYFDPGFQPRPLGTRVPARAATMAITGMIAPTP
jgi:hypothetical protein